MPRQPEGKAKQAIKRYLEGEGAVVYAIHGGDGPFQEVGIPDLLACWHGYFVGIEVKQPGQKPTKLQQRNLDRIAAAGGLSLVATSVEDVVDYLSKRARKR
jgi:hypothetical protein